MCFCINTSVRLGYSKQNTRHSMAAICILELLLVCAVCCQPLFKFNIEFNNGTRVCLGGSKRWDWLMDPRALGSAFPVAER